MTTSASFRPWWCHAILGVLVVLMFGDLAFSGSSVLLGSANTDMQMQFVAWREFGFRELAQGNYALWNPHIYGGAPYAGGMQAALLYPLNWLFMLLPTAIALNVTIAINVWLTGSFMCWWGMRRKLHPAAALVGATAVMFGTPHFLHIHAGHVTNLAAMPWAVLILLAIDSWLDERNIRWLVLGATAVTMQIFAGHPQYVYFTGIAGVLYTMLRLAFERRVLFSSLKDGMIHGAGVAGMFVAGAMLGAVQLLPGMQATRDTIRGEALPRDFASMFAMPPENLLTLVAPSFFGTAGVATDAVPYWGRWYLWEASLHIGIVALVLAGMAATQRNRYRWPTLCMVFITFLFALGKYTPLYDLLYGLVPGFDRFRSIGKFVFQSSLFLGILAATGFDRVLTTHRMREQVSRRATIALGSAAGALVIAALVVRGMEWDRWFERLAETREVMISREVFEQLVVAQPLVHASNMLLLSAALVVSVLVVLLLLPRLRYAPAVLCVAAVGELYFVARSTRTTFEASLAAPAAMESAVRRVPGDARVVNVALPNSAMLFGAQDVWGFDPGVARRWAELVSFTQFRPTPAQRVFDRSSVTQYVGFQQMHPLLALTRLHTVIAPQPDGSFRALPSPFPPLPRFLLAGSVRTAQGLEATVAALADSTFNPRRDVVLEATPQWVPSLDGSKGTVSVLRENTDRIELTVSLPAPAVLLMTDAWTPSWRAWSREQPDNQFDVVPANHALRGIPLPAGEHTLVIAYDTRPLAFGAAISLVTALLLATAWWLVTRRSVPAAQTAR